MSTVLYCIGCYAEIPRPKGVTPKEYCSKACMYRSKHRYSRNELLTALLHELAPDGLTDDCPARRQVAA